MHSEPWAEALEAKGFLWKPYHDGALGCELTSGKSRVPRKQFTQTKELGQNKVKPFKGKMYGSEVSEILK